ncbi:adenylate/guanylate cyclase domain-containing protein [Bradyrhizobium sp. 26S5]|uniref:adenylate/guanylate cyclase domain-containing protein n=1 Tax=Bradyrhizobium sp. 26S5 TaxID=3139729 RepID=UPI0030D3810D
MSNERVERRLAAVLAADVAGYSRLMGADEEETLARLKAVRKTTVDPTIASHRGHVVKTTGDGMLIEFASAVDAVRGAVEIQRSVAEQNAGVPPDQRIEFRIGIHVGDVIFDDNDIFGDGVNIAARLESIAEPGGICMSDDAYRQVRGKVEIAYDDIGQQSLKNIAEPMRAWRVRPSGQTPSEVRSGSAVSQPPVLSLPDKPSIAVLPFQNMSGDPEQEYFADGLTEDIITELAHTSTMSVIARNSTFVYKGKAVDVKQVGRDLGTRYVLEGSVRRIDRRVRVTAQLVETAMGRHLWAEKYDRDLADIFEIQDEITRSVVGSTQCQVVFSEGVLAERSERPDFRTWDLAKRGWKEIYGLTSESIARAREIGVEVTRIDLSFAKGHQLLAAATYHLALMGFSSNPREMLEAALQSAQQAIRLDDADEYSYWMLGGILGQGLGYHDKAIAAYRRALELNPNFLIAFGSLGTVLALAGRAEESIQNSETCLRLNPREPGNFFRFSGLALAYFVAQDYVKAREWSEKAVQRKRDWWQGHALLAVSFALLGEQDAARAAIGDWLLAIPSTTVSNLPPIPFRNATDAERFRDALRKAGLPE